jgi:thioredoxin-like negative regulator of GroEL
MQPVLDALKEKYGSKLNIIRIDAGQQAEIMKQMNLPAIPVFILYKNGKEVFRKNGIVAQSDFETAIQPNL